jgi:hypothetical protein
LGNWGRGHWYFLFFFVWNFTLLQTTRTGRLSSGFHRMLRYAKKKERKKETSRDLGHLDSPADLKMPVLLVQYMKFFIRFVFNRKEQPESHTHACRDADCVLNLTPSKKLVTFVFVFALFSRKLILRVAS